MALSVAVLADLAVGALEVYLDKGKVWKQNVKNKPMLREFNARAGKFSGGNEYVSLSIKSGQGGLSLTGFTADDTVTYGNPTGRLRPKWAWKEHHMGLTVTGTELKRDGIDIIEDSADQTLRDMPDREQTALINLMDEKLDDMGEDYAKGLDTLLHGDGTGDAKALAGIQSFILANPALGSTGGVSRATYTYWRNRAATAAAFAAGSGYNAITSSTANGGALIQFLQEEERRRTKFASGSTSVVRFAGSDFIAAYETELRANGKYTDMGWGGKSADGAMGEVAFGGKAFIYDPSLDDLGLSKRMYAIDMSRRGIQLLYMDGQRYKKHNPARPYDKYVHYSGITMTGVVVARQLNTSGVYDIA